jgi:hypothetical protein
MFVISGAEIPFQSVNQQNSSEIVFAGLELTNKVAKYLEKDLRRLFL